MSITKIREPRAVHFAWNDLESDYDLGDYAGPGRQVQLRVATAYANTAGGLNSAPQELPVMVLDADGVGRVAVPGDLIRRCFDEPEPPTGDETARRSCRALPGETVYWQRQLEVVVDGQATGDGYVSRVFCALRGCENPDRHAVGRDDWNSYTQMQRLDASLDRPLVIGQYSGHCQIVDSDEDVLLHVWPCQAGVSVTPLYVRVRPRGGRWSASHTHLLECGKVHRLCVSPRTMDTAATSYEVELSYDAHFTDGLSWTRTYAVREVFSRRQRLLALDRYGVMSGIGCLVEAEGETQGDEIETLARRGLDLRQRRTVYTATMAAWPGKRLAEAQLWPWLWLWLDGAWRQCTPLPGTQQWLLDRDASVSERQMQFVMTGRLLSDYTGRDTTLPPGFTPDDDEPAADTGTGSDDYPVVPLFPARPAIEQPDDPTAPYVEPDGQVVFHPGRTDNVLPLVPRGSSAQQPTATA